MKIQLYAALAAAVLVSTATGAVAASKKAEAPGQDRTCLVTTQNPNSFNDTDVITTKWLPRKAAEAQVEKDPSTMRTFDYDQDQMVTNGTYASAEELCNKHFVK